MIVPGTHSMPCPDQARVTTSSGRCGLVRLLVTASIIWGAASPRIAHADNTVSDWNNEILLITQQTSGNLVDGPPEVARDIAQVGEAMADAVNAASGSPYSSFAYTGGSVLNANANIAAATAAYTALTDIFTDPAWQTPISTVTGSSTPNNSNVDLADNVVIPELQSFLSSQLSSLGLTSPGTLCTGSSSSACIGYNLGIAAADAVDSAPGTSPTASGAIAAMQNGLKPQAAPGSGTVPGVYVPPTARPEMLPTWGGVTPTGLSRAQTAAAQALVNGPPSIGTQGYANALLQTECEGSSVGLSNLPANIQSACATAGFSQETKEEASAALFWNDPGTTIQPPGHWLQIADTAMISQGSNLLQSARLTALLGEAMNDAGIAAWGDKYAYNLWRPVTAIQDCGAGGTASGAVTWSSDFTTCDTTWTSLIATPPHPDYLAGHPAFSGAAATVLADFFGTDSISFSSSSDYYCNGGSNIFNSANQPIACTLGGKTYYICSASTTPVFDNSDLPVGCTDGTNIFPLTGADCNTVTSTGVNNGSPLICPISETFDSFTEASSGPNGAEFSRVVGGIHTPFAVEDALTVGDGIGEEIAASAGLPQTVPEPSTLSLYAVPLFALTRHRRRRRAFAEDDIGLRKDIPPEHRAAVLSAAMAFRDELARADKWEATHTQ